MPVFLIGGEKDPLITTAKTVERVRKLIPLSQVEIILPDRGDLRLNLPVQIIPFLVE